MSDPMGILWQVAGFILGVSLLVAVHEYGHYWAARRLGFKVLRFSVGFGPALWKRVAGADRTEYVIAALPLGGYVKLLDEREGPVPDADLARSFTRRPPWQRILVLLAGPAANFAFAILVLWGMLWAMGSPEVRPVVGRIAPDSMVAQAGLRADDEILRLGGREVSSQGEVLFGLIDAMSDDGVARFTVRAPNGGERDVELRVEDAEARRVLTEPAALMRGIGFRFWSPVIPPRLGRVLPDGPAAMAGLREGDLVTAVDGVAITDFAALAEAVNARPNSDIALRFRRDGVEREVTLRTSAEIVQGREIGRIRIEPTPPPPLPESMVVQRSFGPVGALVEGSVRAWDMTVLQAKMFGRMLLGQVSLKNLSGPLTIAEYAGSSARSGLVQFLGFLVVISLSLGFLNLLPIPNVDGGQIVYQTIEWIKGAPLAERIQIAGQNIGIVMLLMLMGLALFNDVAGKLG
ncbi:MAG: RIP metalloprotease RseP [Gammaproteobacteria bacterium]